MSTEKTRTIDKKTTGWEGLIAETRKRIERLEMAIEVFEENIRNGFPFDGEAAGTNEKKSVPA